MGRCHEGQRNGSVRDNGGKVLSSTERKSHIGKESDVNLRALIVDAKPHCVLQGCSDKAMDLYGDQGEKTLGHLFQ